VCWISWCACQNSWMAEENRLGFGDVASEQPVAGGTGSVDDGDAERRGESKVC